MLYKVSPIFWPWCTESRMFSMVSSASLCSSKEVFRQSEFASWFLNLGLRKSFLGSWIFELLFDRLVEVHNWPFGINLIWNDNRFIGRKIFHGIFNILFFKIKKYFLLFFIYNSEKTEITIYDSRNLCCLSFMFSSILKKLILNLKNQESFIKEIIIYIYYWHIIFRK